MIKWKNHYRGWLVLCLEWIQFHEYLPFQTMYDKVDPRHVGFVSACPLCRPDHHQTYYQPREKQDNIIFEIISYSTKSYTQMFVSIYCVDLEYNQPTCAAQ